MAERSRLDGRTAPALALLAAFAALAIATLTGAVPDLFALVAGPPPIARAALAGLAIVLGGRLLVDAVRRIERSMRQAPGAAGSVADADLGTMVRGVRLVFLAVASFTAAVGWLLAEPLPIVIALVIAGVDVIETSFLLLVATWRRPIT